MNSTQTLPATYREIGTLDARTSKVLPLVLALVGLVVMAFTSWLSYRALFALRPADAQRIFQGSTAFAINGWYDLMGVFLAVLAFLVSYIIMISLHEAIHGLFFWRFTRSRPQFAIHMPFVSASAPGWYIPRNPYLIIELAPLVVLTLSGLAMLSIAPSAWLVPAWLMITLHTAGSAGDLLVAVWLLLQPPTCLAHDNGDAITLFKSRNKD